MCFRNEQLESHQEYSRQGNFGFKRLEPINRPDEIICPYCNKEKAWDEGACPECLEILKNEA